MTESAKFGVGNPISPYTGYCYLLLYDEWGGGRGEGSGVEGEGEKGQEEFALA